MTHSHVSSRTAIGEKWEQCEKLIENLVDPLTFQTVIKSIQPVMQDSNTLALRVSSPWMMEKLTRISTPLKDAVTRVLGGDVNPIIILNETEEKESAPEPSIPITSPAQPGKREEITVESEKALNPRYKFDSFIVGSGNRFAAAAAQAVGDSPAGAYNPLFIYGGVGLGKTHLINAIGHKVLERKPNARVVYVSTEKFMNDMIESIQEKKMKKFRRRYRGVDVLLIDDIQFIKNKESTQEEFFHTFNELHGSKSQIVITSDRPPKDIPTLEDRLRSRFEWGLIADISPPDFETRMAILIKKAEVENFEVPNEVISFIAENISSNIRELEGALNRVILYASFMKRPVDLDLTIEALKQLLPDSKPKHLTVRHIQKKVCEYYDIRMEEIMGRGRDNRLVIPRQVAMYFSKELLGLSYPVIGREFGGRDHTTVMHACRKIRKKKRDASMKKDLENVTGMLNSAVDKL